jgi:hypothetical protein
MEGYAEGFRSVLKPVLSPTYPQYSDLFKSGDTIICRLNFKSMDTQNITHITIQNALMAAWDGDLLGRDTCVWGR